MDNNLLTKKDISEKDSIDEIVLRPGAVHTKAMWRDELNKMCDNADKNKLTPTYTVPIKSRRNFAIEDQSKNSSRNLNEFTPISVGNYLGIYSYIPADSQSRLYESEFAENSLISTAFTFQEPYTLEYTKLFQRKGFQEVTFPLNETSDTRELSDKLWTPYLIEAERKIWMDPVKKKLNKRSILSDKYPAMTVTSKLGRTATYKGFRGLINYRATTYCMGCSAKLANTQSKSYQNILAEDPLALTTPKKAEETLESWSPYLTEYERKIWKTDEFVGNDSSKWSTEKPCSSDDIRSYLISPIKEEEEEYIKK